jgi:hypothetical protein
MVMTTVFIVLTYPAAGGSGIPEVLSWLNGQYMPQVRAECLWYPLLHSVPAA